MREKRREREKELQEEEKPKGRTGGQSKIEREGEKGVGGRKREIEALSRKNL